MAGLQDKNVVVCFLRNRGEVLLLRQPAEAAWYGSRWDAVSGMAEEPTEDAALQHIDAATGLGQAVYLAQRGVAFPAEDAVLGIRWLVHPFLFDCAHRDLRRTVEAAEVAWMPPPALLRRSTVPHLWTAYTHVAPTVEAIQTDREQGAAVLSYRALEVLRDRAGGLVYEHAKPQRAWEALSTLASRLLIARPAMAVIANRVNRVMHACRQDASAEAVERAAQAGLDRALAADEATAQHAAGYLAGRRTFTLSRSGTVLDALRRADPPPSMIVVAASQPGGEGVAVAEALARDGFNVTLVPDAAVLSLFGEGRVDVVLVGADTILPSGRVVNKVGTHAAALAAKAHHIPFYVASASDKVSLDKTPFLEDADHGAVYAGTAPLEVFSPRFDVTPGRLLSGIITEDGILAPVEMQDVAFELKALAVW